MYDEALELFRAVEDAETVALGDQHPDVASTRHSIAGVLSSMGKYGETLMLYRAVEKTKVAALGDRHRSVAATRYGMAGVLSSTGKYEDEVEK